MVVLESRHQTCVLDMLNMLGSFRLFLQVAYDRLNTEEITLHQA
jgi:hypothetical protein